MKSIRQILFILALVNAAIAVIAVYCLSNGAFISGPRANAKRLDELVPKIMRLPPEKAVQHLRANMQASRNLAFGWGKLMNEVASITVIVTLGNTAVLMIIWFQSRKFLDISK